MIRPGADADHRKIRGGYFRIAGILAIASGLFPLTGQAARPDANVPTSAVAPSRLAAISATYRGTPYKLDCLGEGRRPDNDPLFTRKYADCQTLVEQVMAEALAPHLGGLDTSIRTIRYRDGHVSINSRHHYCIPDWLTYSWPVRDVTSELGGKQVRSVSRRIDLASLLGERQADLSVKPPVRSVTTAYIPRADVRSVLSRIPDGSIVVFVLDRPGIVAGHLGFVFRTEKGVILRHASQRKMRVIDEPLSQYIGIARKSVVGIKVLQPDVQGLSRQVKS